MESLVNYALSAFPNSLVNAGVLADQINSTRAIGQRLSFVTLDGSTVSLAFPAPVTGSPKTALDGVVAAHQGRGYGPGIQTANAMAQQSNNTTGDVVAVALVCEPLQAGKYQFQWICEIAPSSNVANTGARVAVQSNVSGSFADHFEKNVNAPPVAIEAWDTFTGVIVATLATAGTTPTVRLVWRRLGASSNAALIRRARLVVSQLSD